MYSRLSLVPPAEVTVCFGAPPEDDEIDTVAPRSRQMPPPEI